MQLFVNTALFIMAPIAALAFSIEYGWSDWLEQKKPKIGARGQPLGTTPPGYAREQSQIDKETPIIEKFNDDTKAFEIHKKRFDKIKPYLKRIRLCSGVLTFLFGCLKLALLA